ncbi:hypothetical protein GCM10029992_34210 [Glycomyces albus]
MMVTPGAAVSSAETGAPARTGSMATVIAAPVAAAASACLRRGLVDDIFVSIREGIDGPRALAEAGGARVRRAMTGC